MAGIQQQQLVNDTLPSSFLVAEINQTFLVVIPKVAKSESLFQFRPISLCNVNFKILTKVIVNRLKPMIVCDGISLRTRC